MSEHKTDWLGPYLDGELEGKRLVQVEAHLAQCETCQKGLAELRQLSAILQESPDVKGLQSPAAFVAQVVGKLEGRHQEAAWQRALRAGWRLAPAGLLGAWAFGQALAIVATVALLAVRAGVGGEVLAGLLPAGGEGWMADLAGLSSGDLGGLISAGWSLLRGSIGVGWTVAAAVVPLAVVALLYCGWLAFWWSNGGTFRSPVGENGTAG